MCGANKRKNENPIIDDNKCSKKEHENYVKDVINALSLWNGEFVIAAVSLDEAAKHYHRWCPQILGYDVMFRATNEMSGLYRGVSIYVDGHNLPNFQSFIPSSQSWV